MKTYQQQCRDVYKFTTGQMSMRDRIASQTVGLAEESGEVCKAVRAHLWRDKRNVRDNVLEELGDTMFFVAVLADTFGFTLEEVQEENLAKMRIRYPDAIKSNDLASPEVPVVEPFHWVELNKTRFDLLGSSGKAIACVRQRRDESWSVRLTAVDEKLIGKQTFYDLDSAKSWAEREITRLRGCDEAD